MRQQKGAMAIWLTSGSVVLCTGMLVLMIVLILGNGLPQFWPRRLVELELTDGTRWLGELHREEHDAEGNVKGVLLKIGNRDVYGIDFKWFDAASIKGRRQPSDAVAVERLEYGYFFGYLDLAASRARIDAGIAQRKEAEHLFHDIESRRLPVTRARHELAAAEARIKAGQGADEAVTEARRRLAEIEGQVMPGLEEPSRRLEAMRQALASQRLEVRLADGQTKELPIALVERTYAPNAMSGGQKLRDYLSELVQFLWQDPRESNTEGGVFPAIFGTVMMVMIMSVAVVPLGVLTAVYMHEYARAGRLLRIVRLAVSNLAGVPSIVFGLFGLGFFVYFVGGGIDRVLFGARLPEPTFGTGGILWASLTLALLTVPSVIVATEEGLAAVPRANRDGALALGSTKFQMIRNVVIPQAMPGILTGAILAVSRGAGEVAPLMITGVVKLAKDLPFSGQAPFLHLERKFMHLGFHVYDVSMQSPNIEAAKPMVYTTTLVLLLIVLLLNSGAIVLRNRLRRAYRGSAL